MCETLMSDNERPKGMIFCSRDGKWKEQLEKRLQTDERVTLTALGDVRYDVMRYVEGRKDVKIVKLETRYMKSREKRNSSPEEIEKKILPLVSKTHFRNISKLLSGIDGA
jgi:hypothetical protein